MIAKEEYELLKNYRAKGYGWIARNKKGNLCAFKVMPVKSTPFWTVERGFHLPCLVGERGDNILTCVTWKDEEPTKINDLINEYEAHLIITNEKVKVTVPQYVADWIEEVKGLKRNFKLEYLFDTTTMPDKVYDWLEERYGDTDILAKAWLDGFEVEKEKLYILKFSNGHYLHGFDLRGDETLGYKLTQAEIESIDPRLMQFAEEVE